MEKEKSKFNTCNSENERPQQAATYKIKIDEEKYQTFRRFLHKIPELGFEEVETKSLILNFIKSFPNFSKIKITEIGKTGFWIDVNGLALPNTALCKKGKDTLSLSFRTDIDGLPLREQTIVEYKSLHEGKAHSCGHDGHMTIMTCFMEYILHRLEQVPSNVQLRFLYQPAEECGSGAIPMIEGGCLDGIDEIYGLHNLTLFDLGEIGIKKGAIMASIDIFNINITGVGGHGSTPHITRSPITTGSEIILKLNQITSQRINSLNRCTVTVGKFSSGEAHNVIPEKAQILGSYRTLDKGTKEEIGGIIRKTCKCIAETNDSQVDVEIKTPGTVTENNDELTEVVLKAVGKAGFKQSSENLPLMGSEDFSFYQEKIPGVFFMVGTRDEDHQYYIHSPFYNYNDKGTPYGVEMFVRILEVKIGIGLIDI